MLTDIQRISEILPQDSAYINQFKSTFWNDEGPLISEL